ncbi:MAG: hypothetical protein ACLFPL_03705 [Candidatus Nanoarchaeia archaeon]
MGTQYFTLEHETLEILNEFPILKDVSLRNHYGLEEVGQEGETLAQTLALHKYSDEEKVIILRKLNTELEKLYSKPQVQ